jgi:hypothetical protein
MPEQAVEEDHVTGGHRDQHLALRGPLKNAVE